ncbi:hypothetical protein CY789_06815 [Campylobacter coli]|uniref:hypothetical protein n=1 Tax=Campylobacter coli TaxID=195 RepID=UPI000257C6A0|nr:hypothetical protein [Campylobacter coli]EIA86971.1 hypothetical protein cco7_06457 [Campylobacter coli 67-8]EAC2164490.1 hypothetical protein [Campylobacter coli]EAH4472285.1 hypothetical protein [Campylobacter coli]EAH7887182.1 hypothetical protein [Campylobacter coli]EAH7890759.1 hypothetical protein [Campylobacter coli]
MKILKNELLFKLSTYTMDRELVFDLSSCESLEFKNKIVLEMKKYRSPKTPKFKVKAMNKTCS